MKKIFILPVLILMLVNIFQSGAFASYKDIFDDMEEALKQINIGPIMLPDDPEEESDILALQLLGLNCAQDAQNTAMLFSSAGFEILKQKNYDKEITDPSHTCAYTIGKGIAYQGMKPVEAILVSIRGTSGGEWYSNFDFFPSNREGADVAENFMFAAADVFNELMNYTDNNDDAVIIICGHSRGAACANLLGVLLNTYTNPERIYDYTFATPGTIRNNISDMYSLNIFNFINPSDIVPELPLAEWGFKRAGTDIYLGGEDSEAAADKERYLAALQKISSSVGSYYNDRHSLYESGLSDTGITAFELMLAVSDKLTGITDEAGKTDSEVNENWFSSENISSESDLYPLWEIFAELADNDYDKGINMLMQHLPTTYIDLMKEKMNRTGQEKRNGIY